MAKRYRLREIEKERGNLHDIIPSLVNIGGQAHAARILGLTQATISRWLKENGYQPKVMYTREAHTA